MKYSNVQHDNNYLDFFYLSILDTGALIQHLISHVRQIETIFLQQKPLMSEFQRAR